MSSEIRIPESGEGWRHFKGGCESLYRILGTARDEGGNAVVVYAPYIWSLAQTMPLYTRKLGDFLKEVSCKKDPHTGRSIMEQRFRFEREA